MSEDKLSEDDVQNLLAQIGTALEVSRLEEILDTNDDDFTDEDEIQAGGGSNRGPFDKKYKLPLGITLSIGTTLDGESGDLSLVIRFTYKTTADIIEFIRVIEGNNATTQYSENFECDASAIFRSLKITTNLTQNGALHNQETTFKLAKSIITYLLTRKPSRKKSK